MANEEDGQQPSEPRPVTFTPRQAKIYEQLTRRMYRHDLHRIIRAGLISNDIALQKDATAFANELVARGFNQFREVLDRDYRLPDDDGD